MSTFVPDIILHDRRPGDPPDWRTDAADAAGPKFFAVIAKPFDLSSVARVVAAAMERGRITGV
ncbi:MAG TPA: hypothetical protein VFV05_02840 [Methylomirabilota bacterium]|nr:hypothetical protein [Methylomirabilota bacterium]